MKTIKTAFLTLHALMGFTCWLCACSSVAQVAPLAWQYDLRPGDHLIYHYDLQQEVKGRAVESGTRITFITHVLVLGEKDARLSVGFQRNLESAQLLYYRENGKDELAEEIPKFEQRIARRPIHFDEANEISASGEALNFWQAVRETDSKVLMAVHEIEALPKKAVVIGDHWKGTDILSFEFRFVGTENVAGEQCDLVEGTRGGLHLRYWWCPQRGVLGKIEFDGSYSKSDGTSVHERLSFELQAKNREERISDWLRLVDTRQGALQALLLSNWVPVSSQLLSLPLKSSETRTEALALACIDQRQLQFPDRDLITKFTQSENPELKRIATHIAQPPSFPSAVSSPADCPATPSHVHHQQKVGTYVRFMNGGPLKDMPFLVHVPDDYRADRSYPLLIYLSGAGGMRVDDLDSVEQTVDRSGYLVLYPQAEEVWWDTDVMLTFTPLLRQILQDFNVDLNRIYIAGFSAGATGALYYAAAWPQSFAGVVSLMGAGICLPDIASTLPDAANLPVLFIHGDKDPRVPVTCSSRTYEALRKLSPQTASELKILKDRGSDITLEDDGGLSFPFLEQQVRNPFPRKVSARIPALEYPRRYWLEVSEKGSGVAEVDGELTSGNTVELKTKNVKRLRLLLRPELFASAAEIKVLLNGKEVFQQKLKHDCVLFQRSAEELQDPILGYTDALEFDVDK